MSALAVRELPLRPTLVEEAVPRPEYPQPQFQREEWQNLNGYWEFEFDDDNVGLEENWANGGHDFSRMILVPFCFESSKSGIGDTAFHPVAWYRRRFLLRDEWEGRRVLLNFGAVDYRATVWVNGRQCGEQFLAETVALSEIVGRVWRELDEAQRQRVSARVAELTAPFTAADGSITLPARTLVACAEA